MKTVDVSKPLDIKKIEKVIATGEEIEVSSYILSREFDEFVNNLLTVFISECNLERTLSSLSYSTDELLANANKANCKRVFFAAKHLDINNADDYKKGMLTFSTETTVNNELYQKLQADNKFFIKFRLSFRDEIIKLEVINNAVLTEIEKQRIALKMESAKKYNSMEEALTDIDRTEGSGLGLIIIILMLKQLGITKDCLQLGCENGETYARIILPINELAPLPTFDEFSDLECI